MTNKTSSIAGRAGFLTAVTFLVSLTGCLIEGPGRQSDYREHPVMQGQPMVVIEDDYDYYPAYETYYSRNRHEYVYREGNSWVRRSEPRGVSLNVLLAAPSVRLDFRDSPERHNDAVVKSYPKNWQRPGKAPVARENHRNDKNDEKKKDRKDGDRRD